MTKDESRAITFLGVLLCLALVARYMNRPKPVVINAGTVDIEALREAGRSLAQKPPQPKPRRRTSHVETNDTPRFRNVWTRPAGNGTREAPAERTTGPLNINAATKEEIEKLPWIGPAMAERIIGYRDSVKGFAKLEDLDAVKGIGPALLKKLEPLITF